MKLAGIDLAWHSDKNPSAIAIGALSGRNLILDQLEPAIFGMSNILDVIVNQKKNMWDRHRCPFDNRESNRSTGM